MLKRIVSYIRDIMRRHAIPANERKEIYKELIRRFSEDRLYFGICHELSIINKDKKSKYHYIDNYPEIMAQKPKNINKHNGYWFSPGRAKPRIELLRKALEML